MAGGLSRTGRAEYHEFLTGSSITGVPIPGTYLYELPEGGLVRLNLDALDRMLVDIMRGFGAVPKRGAEVGGILLGAVERNEGRVIRVEDYVAVPIQYRRGPSYLMSVDDIGAFEAALERARAEGKWKPVGFFRSHTREAPGLTEEDRRFCAEYFPGDDDIVLLIRPYATKVSTAGFIARRDGQFPLGDPAVEFPFRRRELEPGAADEPRVRGEGRRARRPRDPEPALSPAPAAETATPSWRDDRVDTAGPAPVLPIVSLTPEIPLARKSSRWEWLHAPLWLSLFLVLLGGVLGFEATQWMLPPGMPGPDAFRMPLTATSDGSDVRLNWDRGAPAIYYGLSGSVTIEDGGWRRTVLLTPEQLRSGALVYRRQSDRVRFRFEVVSRDGTTVANGVDWPR